jgi:hypothetical protein
MSSNSGARPSKAAWLLPFPLSFCMAVGALVGWSLSSAAARQEGPAGDAAGAAGALLIVICVVVGFAVSLVTVVLARLLRRGAPARPGLRLVLALVGGAVLGVLVTASSSEATAAAWGLLVGVPALASWPWRTVTAPAAPDRS